MLFEKHGFIYDKIIAQIISQLLGGYHNVKMRKISGVHFSIDLFRKPSSSWQPDIRRIQPWNSCCDTS